MRPVICFLLSLSLLFVVGCELNRNNTTSNTLVNASESDKKAESDKSSSKSSATSKKKASKVSTTTTSKEKETSVTDSTSTESTSSQTSQHILYTGSLIAPVIEQNNKSSSTKPVSSSSSIFDDMVYYEYDLNCTIVDWFVEEELVYAGFENQNRYVIFNTANGEIVTDIGLPGRPAKMRLYGKELWISFPDLYQIKIYDKNTLEEKRAITLQNEVSSFDVYGDYLVYIDDHTQHAFKHNIETSTTEKIAPSISSFTYADILVNNKTGMVYIGESQTTGSKLYCYDIETLELKSKFVKDNYGYNNSTRRIFLLDDSVYWGKFKLNANDVSKTEAEYASRYSVGMFFVNKDFVATNTGIYMRNTCKQILSVNLGTSSSAIAITNSGNIFFVNNKKLYIFLETA